MIFIRNDLLDKSVHSKGGVHAGAEDWVVQVLEKKECHRKIREISQQEQEQ